jgi:hypothetical protein
MGFGVINEIRDTILFITLKGDGQFCILTVYQNTFYGVLFNKKLK